MCGVEDESVRNRQLGHCVVCSAWREKEHSGLWSTREGFPVEAATELGRWGVPSRKGSERESSRNKSFLSVSHLLMPGCWPGSTLGPKGPSSQL